MTSSGMNYMEKKNLSPAAMLQHISEQLDVLIQLVKNSTPIQVDKKPDELAPSNSEVMTIKEAAAMLRISMPKMYEFAHSGKIHALSIGRRVLVSRTSIMDLLREGEHNGNETC